MATHAPTPDESEEIGLPTSEWRTAYCPACDRRLAIIRGVCGVCGTVVFAVDGGGEGD